MFLYTVLRKLTQIAQTFLSQDQIIMKNMPLFNGTRNSLKLILKHFLILPLSCVLSNATKISRTEEHSDYNDLS